MFKLLSKESNIFSIPGYIIFLLLISIVFNILNISLLNIISATILFLGVSLAYFAFHKIDLTYHSHLPLFLYTFFIFSLYSGNIDIGIAVSLLTNAFLLMILSIPDEGFRSHSYVLIGSILAINYIFLPTTWPMLIFVILHIIVTSKNRLLNIFRLMLGIMLIALSYLFVAYFLGYNSFNYDYLPINIGKLMTDFYPLYILSPIVLLMIYAIADHFNHYNEKNPKSRFKYTFILIFMLTQIATIVLYMGEFYEYLLLMAFPASVILSRMLKFLPKYWMQEIGLWLIILCLLLFKIGQFYNFTL